MNPDIVQAAADNPWMAIAPELAMACLALLLLVADLILPRSKRDLVPAISIAGQLGILVGLLVNWNAFSSGQPIFNGMLLAVPHTQFLRAFFVGASLLTSLLGVVTLTRQRLPKVEFFVIVQVISTAMMLLSQANHFVLMFVTLETVTVGSFILVGYIRTSPLSLEAGLKYLVIGALSSGLLLFGIALLYGAASNPALPASSANAMNFAELTHFLQANPDNTLAAIGLVLVLAGVAFKIGAVPFQIWIPDVYQGAPTPVTAFLAVSSKAVGFAILLILVKVFAPYAGLVATVIALMAAATILFGNLAALTQSNVKRLLGLSGVAHAGYLLIGVLAAMTIPAAVSAIYFYLFAYLFASFAVFGVMAHVAGANDADQELDHYAELSKRSPFLAGVLAVGLGSMAGIPPLAGFMGKLLIFWAAFAAANTVAAPFGASVYYALLGIAVVGVMISIYYYFGWIKAAYFKSAGETAVGDRGKARGAAPVPVALSLRFALTVLTVGTIVFGFYQLPITDWLILR